MTRTHKIPGPDHPITIAHNGKRVRVTIAGHVVADTDAALALREASYPPVFYIPRADVDMTSFARTKTSTWCPYKGECSYYQATVGGKTIADAAWSYEQPFEEVAAIRDCLAFYSDRVDAIVESED